MLSEGPTMPDFADPDIEAMAEEVFELSNASSIARARGAGASTDLSDAEYLTLETLLKDQPLTVGEIQKRIAVQPAQMSRILRSLENRPKSYVECRINAQDRRCVDVTVTAAGKAAHRQFRKVRLGFTAQILANLPPEDRVQFMRILRRIREGIVAQLAAAEAADDGK
ncbi:MAG: MarR family transcriptional regulator [Phycisphaerales bacterium]|nr:MAG: MarR family transcriptional regulator [Phycisphaerales bacterium]